MSSPIEHEESTTSAEAREVLRQLVEEAGIALFEHYEISLQITDTDATDLECVAVIGFSSDVLRGALGLAISRALLDTSFEGIGNINDWVGELTNQMLGRLKNLLLRYDVTLYLATPMVLRGLKLELATTGRQQIIAVRYAASEGNLCVWLDVNTEPGLELRPSDDPDEMGMEEGALLFF